VELNYGLDKKKNTTIMKPYGLKFHPSKWSWSNKRVYFSGWMNFGYPFFNSKLYCALVE
jgi:hypothetical protein